MKKVLFIILLFSNFEGLQAQQAYINRIWHFGETEFYIYLNFKNGHDWTSLEYLNTELGDFTYKGDESSRRALPIIVAEKYFDLTSLQDLVLYEKTNLGDLSFKGVEYYDDMIFSSYIAVFESKNFVPDQANRPTEFFCMSSSAVERTTKNLKISPTDNSAIKSKLKKSLNFTDQQLMKLESKTVGPMTLSILSYFDSEQKNYSYLLESEGDEFIPLKFIQDQYVMWSIIPTALMINEKPVLIMEMGVPDTDNNWTQLAVFDGKSYQLKKNSFVVSLD